MKENEWVSVNDCLPGIKKKVEIKYIDTCGKEYFGTGIFVRYTDTAIFKINRVISSNEDYFFNDISSRADSVFTHWRYPPEKIHDFSRLKSGDLIVIEDKNIRVGYFCEIGEEEDGNDPRGIYIDISQCKDVDCGGALVPIDTIKKITRINIKEKTFEEI